MIRTQILGLGSYVPERVVRNEELRVPRRPARPPGDEGATETDDAWIQQRTGIRERRYVPNDGKIVDSDLALEAAKRAIADAGLEPTDIDCIILGTLSPDFHFPGTAVLVQKKLGLDRTSCACFDIRQQCSAFVYGLQMADAFVRAGMYKRILLIGAELHSHSLDFSTRGRDVTVLFGDGAGRDGARPDRDRRSARRHHVHVGARRRQRRDGPLPQDLRDRAAALRRLRRAGPRAATRSCTRRWTASGCSSTRCAAW